MLTGTTSNQDTILYHVQPGDSLNKIIRHYYGPISLQQQQSIIKQLQADNPQITNPNLIHPGQALLIDVPMMASPVPVPGQCPVINTDKDTLTPLLAQWGKATREEQQWLSTMSPLMLGTGAGLTTIDTIFKTNAPLVGEIAQNYDDYKMDKLTKGQYDGRRAKLIHKLKTKLGPTQKLLYGNKPANEVLRISRNKGVKPTVNLTRQVSTMTRISKYASRGGMVLSVAGLGVACAQIANTDNKQEKNEIFVESLGSLGGGLLYTGIATVSIVIAATPIGWVGALLVGAGGVVASVSGGALLKSIYNIYGNNVDLVSKSGTSLICK